MTDSSGLPTIQEHGSAQSDPLLARGATPDTTQPMRARKRVTADAVPDYSRRQDSLAGAGSLQHSMSAPVNLLTQQLSLTSRRTTDEKALFNEDTFKDPSFKVIAFVRPNPSNESTLRIFDMARGFAHGSGGRLMMMAVVEKRMDVEPVEAAMNANPKLADTVLEMEGRLQKIAVPKPQLDSHVKMVMERIVQEEVPDLVILGACHMTATRLGHLALHAARSLFTGVSLLLVKSTIHESAVGQRGDSASGDIPSRQSTPAVGMSRVPLVAAEEPKKALPRKVLVHANPEYRKAVQWLMRCLPNKGHEYVVRTFHTQPDFESQRLANMNGWKATTALCNQWSGRYDEPTSKAIQGSFLQKMPKEAADLRANLVVTSMAVNQGLSRDFERFMMSLSSSLLIIRTPAGNPPL